MGLVAGFAAVIRIVRRQDFERDYALIKLESAEGSKSHALGNLGVHSWPSFHELWAWNSGHAVFSASSTLFWRPDFGAWDHLSRVCCQRSRSKGACEAAAMTSTPNTYKARAVN
jgi:hypothetical protein